MGGGHSTELGVGGWGEGRPVSKETLRGLSGSAEVVRAICGAEK